MTHAWHDVPWETDVREVVHAIIEIPEGSKVKYELHKATGLLIADRVLYSAVHYPANYGFIPRTYCPDGDPLDILVLSQQPLAPLSIARARPIGVMKMRDEKGEDDKVIAAHVDDPQFAHLREITELPEHWTAELRRFFLDYKVLEKKEVTVERMLGRPDAERVVAEAVALYASRKKDLGG
jgi:inorganic pyrophosphatase